MNLTQPGNTSEVEKYLIQTERRSLQLFCVTYLGDVSYMKPKAKMGLDLVLGKWSSAKTARSNMG